MTENTILPVLLGADLNCYSVARAFHEAYGVKSHAFGRYSLGATQYSKIIDFTIVEELCDSQILLETLINFAEKNTEKKLLLFGCTDAYADLIIENQETLSRYYFCPCPNEKLAKKLISKDAFYEMCDQCGIDYPKTVVIQNFAETEKLVLLPFSYPVIIKPSSSIRYWQHPFDGMKKVYTATSRKEAETVIKQIFSSGYDSSLIVQDFIPGDDSGMYVLTSYSDQNANVKMMCLGHVLLEEHTPKGIGNHAAILTEYQPELMERMKAFLESIGYQGFSNFDIKFDPRDGKFKVFEINLRQGRSNYYVTHAGANIARYPVEDSESSLPAKTDFVKELSFWHTVPKKIIYSYIRDKNTQQTVNKLVKDGKAGTSLWYRYDLRANPLRFAYTTVHNLRYFKKYKRYP